jgi:hypothetical protein
MSFIKICQENLSFIKICQENLRKSVKNNYCK